MDVLFAQLCDLRCSSAWQTLPPLLISYNIRLLCNMVVAPHRQRTAETQAAYSVTMPTLNDWLDDQEELPYTTNAIRDTTRSLSATPHLILDKSLATLTLAAAALCRAGPRYVRRSEHFWFFAAGSWSRPTFELKVEEAKTRLPKLLGVPQHEKFAEDRVREAIKVLRRSGDERDARDLKEAFKAYQRDGGADGF